MNTLPDARDDRTLDLSHPPHPPALGPPSAVGTIPQVHRNAPSPSPIADDDSDDDSKVHIQVDGMYEAYK